MTAPNDALLDSMDNALFGHKLTTVITLGIHSGIPRSTTSINTAKFSSDSDGLSATAASGCPRSPLPHALLNSVSHVHTVCTDLCHVLRLGPLVQICHRRPSRDWGLAIHRPWS